MNKRNKIQMKCVQGVWITSVFAYGVEIIATAGDVRVALRGLEESMKYLAPLDVRYLIRGDMRRLQP